MHQLPTGKRPAPAPPARRYLLAEVSGPWRAVNVPSHDGDGAGAGQDSLTWSRYDRPVTLLQTRRVGDRLCAAGAFDDFVLVQRSGVVAKADRNLDFAEPG